MDGVFYVSNLTILNRSLTIQSENGPKSSIIDGNNTSNCLNLIYGSFTLNGITIRNCVKSKIDSISNANHQNSGAALWIENASATLYSLIIINNFANVAGGGIGLNYGSFFLYQCTIENNTANYGGAVYAENATISISATSVIDNQARIDGGGIYEVNGNIDFQEAAKINGNVLSFNNSKNQISCYFANATFENKAIYETGFHCHACSVLDNKNAVPVNICNGSSSDQGNFSQILIFSYLVVVFFITQLVFL